jgi:hypothetical protein
MSFDTLAETVKAGMDGKKIHRYTYGFQRLRYIGIRKSMYF